MNKPSLRVLIVEDSAVMRHLVTLAVSRHGAEVVEVADGQAAQQQIGVSHFDLLFIDLNMPILDGAALIKWVHDKASKETPKICVMTTEQGLETEQLVRQLGAHFYLRKPISRRDVERILGEAFPG